MSADTEHGTVWNRYLNKAFAFKRLTGQEANVLYVGHSDWNKLRMCMDAKNSIVPYGAGGWMVEGKRIVGVMRDNWLEVGYATE